MSFLCLDLCHPFLPLPPVADDSAVNLIMEKGGDNVDTQFFVDSPASRSQHKDIFGHGELANRLGAQVNSLSVSGHINAMLAPRVHMRFSSRTLDTDIVLFLSFTQQVQ